MSALAIFSLPGLASELPPIFYPLKLQSEGQFLAAKQLFSGEEGGLWSIDVHNRVRFFDGHNFTELNDAPFDSQLVTFTQGKFWYAKANKVYSRQALGKSKLVYQAEITRDIQKIDSHENKIWFTDQDYFYAFDEQLGQVLKLEQSEFERFYSGAAINIRAAIEVDGEWWLGTSIGLFKWDGVRLAQVVTQHTGQVTRLFYSTDDQTLLIGYTDGVETYSFVSEQGRYYQAEHSHVLTLEQSSKHYWVGTEHGLFLVDKATQHIDKAAFNENDDFGLAGEKIYSLVADEMSGMWIATDNGVRYFSEYNELFRRSSVSVEDDINRLEAKLEVVANPLGGYWVITPTALYSVDGAGVSTLVFWGKVSSLAQHEKLLWLATDRGLLQLDLARYRVTTLRQEVDRLPTHVDHIAVGTDATLWLSNGSRLMTMNIETQTVKDFGVDWAISEHLPAKITEIDVVSERLTVVGTDHGLYLIEQGQSRFVRQSEPFGSVIEISSSNNGVWVASGYGAFSLSLNDLSFQALPLYQDNIRPICITRSEDATWLVTSVGITAYQQQGNIVQHISAPYGVINNEFINGSCSYSPVSGDVILGSRYGIVEFDARYLQNLQLPQASVLVSKVAVNNSAVRLADLTERMPKIEYGDSISLQLSLWPAIQGSTLIYRSNGSEWKGLTGRQLNIDKPNPGEHRLEIAVSGQQSNGVYRVFEFKVLTPWYMTRWFYALLLMVFVVSTASFIYWRSRRIQAMNAVLKTQVALKTEQLQHQSRVLVGNNQQLRKAFKIRQSVLRELTEQALSHSHQFRLENASVMVRSAEKTDSLNKVRAIFDESGQRSSICPVANVLKFTLSAWKKELDSYGIHVELNMQAQHDHVIVDACNLDIIFNTILANAMRRLVRGQSLSITLDDDGTKLSVTFEDSGLPLPNMSDSHNDLTGETAVNQLDFSPSSLPYHIHNSGGELRPVERSGQNRIVIRWILSGAIDEPTTVLPSSDNRKNETLTVPAVTETRREKYESWKHQVTQLVAEQYSDPDFSTAVVSRSLFISERSFQRRFKSLFSITFTDYLTDVRMEKACEMLLQGEKVAEVAFACGFNDPSYFSQRFKLYFGLPPSKFAIMDGADA
ncbi:AraC family transcriptional regulator [Vibrio hangzhouensis]|uniref:Ligand-binding sensor domain-containing protein n=1 Tax=Vibrio hangzhouensis TaxID=462991 RepID=A0A1H5URH0_9VIBR|nr:AraC family transcriptional regulator [Vibrio hangzhouensis]SEF77702.1 ligand-binding sensor domain-containing protein [Vibrio hangzhouensis]